MGHTLNDLANDFHAIRNGDAIDAFVSRYALSQADPAQYPHVRNLQEVYKGIVCETKITFLHRWHDPSQAFSIQRDINKLELQIEGVRRLTTEYADAL